VACYHPLQAFRTASGEVIFVERKADVVQTLNLPCGRCVGCRLDRSQQWALRIMHEAKLHDASGFVTLTYAEVHNPVTLRYEHFQQFMRRVRYECGPTRFFVCGEYGDLHRRPHFHAGLFGLDFRQDRKRWKKSEAGSMLYRSPTLEKLWPLGFATVADLTLESAAYLARYSFKKVTGDLADAHYRLVDTDTGEVTQLVPEMAHMSLRPGIGADWFARYWADVYPHDRVIMKGRKHKVPKYYDGLLKRIGPDLLEDVQQQRILNAVDKWPDNTPERLGVREQVTSARVKFYKRK
jgi:hypothetical protein